jgi:large subunit ribosomal protein L24
MEKLARKTLQAERNVTQRAKRLAEFEIKAAKKKRGRHQKNGLEDLKQNLRDSRQARWDAWELGPLAPKRDTGTGDYGAIASDTRKSFGVPLRPAEVEARCAWAGKPKFLNLLPKDRVVILEGPDKGKIDVVKSIQIDTGTLQLQNLHQVCPRFLFQFIAFSWVVGLLLTRTRV